MNKNINAKGQGLIEYIVLVSVIAVAAISVVSVVGKNIREQYANISHALQNERKVQFTKPDSRTYESVGMDNYMDSLHR